MLDELGLELPPETVATCSTCVMLPPGDRREAPAGATFFNASTKCCTYLPELHNFLVGRILSSSETDARGRETVEERIAAANGVTPLGLGRSRSYTLLYLEGGSDLFGRAGSMRCPHYLDDGRCGVWQHRESTCATWFCKHVRGKTGHDTWRAVQELLRLAERDLAWWCVRELDIDIVAVQRLLVRRSMRRVSADEVDGTADTRSREYVELWGAWAGREQEFYVACAARVEPLKWLDVLAIGSPELRAAADVASSLASSAAATHDRLTLAALRVTSLRDGVATVSTYNAYDPLSIPIELLEALSAFDGRPTAVVLDELSRERDVEIEHDLLRRLVDFGVLEPI
jgi:hypothetical protein